MVDSFLPVCSLFLIYFLLLSILDTASNKSIGETSQGVVKDAAYSSKTAQQRKVRNEDLFPQNSRFYISTYSELSHM